MITPAQGYIVDPNNPNGVIRDPNVAIAPGGLPVATQPVVTPNNNGSLQGTLTTPTAPTPPAPGSVPPPAAPASGTATPTTPTTPVSPVTGSDFTTILNSVQDKLTSNNALTDQRQLLMKNLFDSPLTPDELAKLPPDVQKIVQSGDKNAMELQLRVINDNLQGRTNTLDKSIQYLTSAYQTDQQALDKKKQDAISNVLNFAQVYGSQAGSVLKSIYGDKYLSDLKAQGVDIDALGATPTLAEKKQNSVTNPTTPGYNGDFAATIQLAADANKNASNAQRAQVTQALQSAIATGDYKSAYQTILQATKANLSGTSATRFENAQILTSTLGDLQNALQAYATAGGNTNILTGTEDQIQTKIGQLETDPKYAALAVQLDTAYQQYRQMLTGANFSAAEAASYASVLPSKNNSLALNTAKIKGAQAAANSTIEGSIKGVVGDGGIYIKQYAEGATPASSGGSEDTSNPANAAIGSTVTINGVQYKKTGNDAYEPI